MKVRNGHARPTTGPAAAACFPTHRIDGRRAREAESDRHGAAGHVHRRDRPHHGPADRLDHRAYAGIVALNLVGNSCVTSTTVSVTMRGVADLTSPATFSGIYTIPPLKTCGALTAALNLVIPGPGNTFTAKATPA
jgi:hypothetical protein